MSFDMILKRDLLNEIVATMIIMGMGQADDQKLKRKR
jgi:hypothetical protein